MTLKPKFRTTGQKTLSINSVLATAAKVSGLWQFGCVISWLISVSMSTLQAPIRGQFLIAITWIRPATSGDWRIYTLYCVLPSMFGGCLKECGGLSVLLSMVPDLLWVLNKYSNTSLFHHWLYQGLERFPSLIKGIFRCSASTGLPIMTEELTLHSKFLPTGLASKTCVLKEIHSNL